MQLVLLLTFLTSKQRPRNLYVFIRTILIILNNGGASKYKTSTDHKTTYEDWSCKIKELVPPEICPQIQLS